MRKKWLLLSCILLCYGCSITKYQADQRSLILAIDFQADFENDMVTFYIEDCLIFEGIELSSNEILGVTGHRVRVYESKKNQIAIEHNDKTINCKIALNKKIQMKVLLNGNLQYLTTNIYNGKYIGFAKVSDNRIYIFQSEYPFIYH